MKRNNCTTLHVIVLVIAGSWKRPNVNLKSSGFILLLWEEILQFIAILYFYLIELTAFNTWRKSSAAQYVSIEHWTNWVQKYLQETPNFAKSIWFYDSWQFYLILWLIGRLDDSLIILKINDKFSMTNNSFYSSGILILSLP